MATVQSIQTVLGTGPQDAQIMRSVRVSSTVDSHYVAGLGDAPGRTRWCDTTASQTASQQAAVILTALRA